jgi:signal transduction histidine kinase
MPQSRNQTGTSTHESNPTKPGCAGGETSEAVSQREKLDSLTRQARGVSHELNNLLQVVLGNARVALRGRDLSEEQREILEEIEMAARRGTRLSQDLLLASARGSMTTTRVDLAATAGALCSDLGLAPPHIEGAQELSGDPDGAMLANAIEAAPDHREGIKVRVGTGPSLDLEGWYTPAPAARVSKPHCWVEVLDRGPGVSLDSCRLCFDPYYTTKNHHSGMGLSIALGVARMHGGTIQISTASSSGSRVRLCLPST